MTSYSGLVIFLGSHSLFFFLRTWPHFSHSKRPGFAFLVLPWAFLHPIGP